MFSIWLAKYRMQHILQVQIRLSSDLSQTKKNLITTYCIDSRYSC